MSFTTIYLSDFALLCNHFEIQVSLYNVDSMTIFFELTTLPSWPFHKYVGITQNFVLYVLILLIAVVAILTAVPGFDFQYRPFCNF